MGEAQARVRNMKSANAKVARRDVIDIDIVNEARDNSLGEDGWDGEERSKTRKNCSEMYNLL